MNKYMVFIPNDKPEVIEAEQFEIDGAILRFVTGDRLTAAFYSWLGLKEIASPSSYAVTSTTTAAAAAALSDAIKHTR